ncbi:MAG: hypothetical protein O3B72_02270 [Proteobacteria bacterium]|nr:hypothetical protein [Pseudomonadota bacterium]
MADRTGAETGVFLKKSSGEYLVIWRGREICRYASIEAFVDAHLEGLQALEDAQAQLLESYYRDLK